MITRKNTEGKEEAMFGLTIPTLSSLGAPLQQNGAAEWRRPSCGITLGVLLFETITGLTIYLLPFSIYNQFAVLAHTVLGILLLPVVIWYVGTHWWNRFRGNLSHYQLLGYLSAAALLATIISGVVLTWQAMFGIRITRFWDLAHIVVGLSLAGLLAAHLATVLIRSVNNDVSRQLLRRARLSCLTQSLASCGVCMFLCGAAVWWYRPVPLNDAFPTTYSFDYGPDRPYAPSLARKNMAAVEDRMKVQLASALGSEQGSMILQKLKPDPAKHVGVVALAEKLSKEGSLTKSQQERVGEVLDEARRGYAQTGAIDPRRLAGSEKCGRCHQQIVDEWLPSAHRYASMDFVFQKVQENMAKELKPAATRYCAGCHDPIAMFSGAKNVGNVTLSAEGAHEGVSCLSCHSIVQTDVRGNGDYTLDPGERYVGEFEKGRVWDFVSDFLIRAYPRQHVKAYTRPLYKTAEACGACHKQFVDEEVNDFGWVQGQNQYDSWRKSRWHKEGDVAGTISCRECHMPLIDSTDPAAGDKDDPNRNPRDGKHRSHRFLGANQFVPRIHKLSGAEKHCDLTVKWLRGEYDVPEIADRWTKGPVVKVAVVAPPKARPGEQITVQTIVTNNKAGHDFPTGPMDMIEGWVEVTVTDSAGKIVFTSSRADDRQYLINPKIVFKAELINKLGELIGKHELWRLVGARYKRVLFPGVSDTTTFEFACPGLERKDDRPASKAEQAHAFQVPSEFAGGELKVTAVVWICKFSAPFLDRLFGAEAGIRSEVTDVSRADAVIRIANDENTAFHTTP